METSNIASQKEVQNSTISRKYNVDIFLGYTMANFGMLWKKGHNSVQCLLQWNASGLVLPDIWAKCQGVFWKGLAMLYDNACLYTAVHNVDSICHMNFEALKHPPCSPDLAPSITCFIHSETIWEAVILPVTKKWKKWCMHRLSLNKKHLFWGHTKACWPLG
jgi:rhamnogalacturonyl hydrolase YesR